MLYRLKRNGFVELITSHVIKASVKAYLLK